jgi:hypothetical protein
MAPNYRWEEEGDGYQVIRYKDLRISLDNVAGMVQALYLEALDVLQQLFSLATPGTRKEDHLHLNQILPVGTSLLINHSSPIINISTLSTDASHHIHPGGVLILADGGHDSADEDREGAGQFRSSHHPC